MTETHKHYFHFDNSLGKNPIRTQYFTLWQVGDLFLAPNESVPEHQQYCFEISFVERGNGTIYAKDRFYSMQKNDLIFSFTDEKHVLQADAVSPFRFFYIALSPAPNTICEAIVNTLQKHCENFGRVFSFPNVFESMKRLLSEFYNKNMFYKEKIEALIIDIMISIYRNVITDSSEKQSNLTQRKDELVYNIVNYIDNCSNELITIKEISRIFFYDCDYISNVFKEIMHVSLRDYLYDMRLNTASKMLIFSDKSITEISLELGYSCIHSFSRSFKAKFGISPQQYRKENEAKSE